MTTPAALTRRSLFALGGTGAGAALLTACTAGGDSTDSAGTDAGSTSSGSPTAGSSGETVALSSIPVGGAASATVDGKPIVLSQPTAGSVVAFSAICPHQGCVVAPARGSSVDRFDCPCHGSRFDGKTGDVVRGPARKGLTALKTTVSGDSVTVS